MSSQRSGLSPFHSHRYNLRSSSNTNAASSMHSTKIRNDEDVTKITDFFNVRKRRSFSSDEESEREDLKKRTRKGIMLETDQMVPDSEENLQSNFSRCSRVTLLKYFPANPFGVFAKFSSETLLVVIDRIPVTLLANLALTSRNFNCSLRRYAMSGSASKRFAKDTDIAVVSARASMTVEDPFYAWGRFLKSITITESVSDRIEYFNVFHVKNRGRCDSAGWGRCMLTFAERWDFNECARLMRSLLAAAENKLYQAMCEVLEGEGGQHPVSEMQVRRGFRELFLEHRYPDVRDSSFWMSAVLRTQFSASRQVKLMYVLFGPTKINDLLEEVVDWRGLCEQPISTSQNSRERLGPLSDAFFRLLQTKSIGASEFIYTETDVFNLLEEITTYPEPWLFDNFVALLLNRPALIPIAFVFRVVHGYHEKTERRGEFIEEIRAATAASVPLTMLALMI
ncbi:F-box only protein 47 [Toxocara canis]|uniref:F-box only protein 47 n=1 Tax=Toxocara canis TaxID=6265 RepID=A0A0B2VPU0_TOXCA|nr:F-box only protein 47 [Toxocara canis]